MRFKSSIAFLLGMLASVSVLSVAQDWYQASGKPVQRSLLSSADLRNEFAAIETNIADKLPVLTGNAGKLIAVNDSGTALEAISPEDLPEELTVTEGSFSASMTGFSGSGPTPTVSYLAIGKMVYLMMPAAGVAGTSNSSGMSMTGLPEALWPSATRTVPAAVHSGGVAVPGLASIRNDGVIVFWAENDAGAICPSCFEDSGSKALVASSVITYPL